MSQEMISTKVDQKLNIEKYVEVFRDIKGSLNVLAMTLEGIANGMEAAEAQSSGKGIGDRIREAPESAAMKRYATVARLLGEIGEHFKPVALGDGSGTAYPEMTDDLMAKILEVRTLIQSQSICDCPGCQAECEQATSAPEAAANPAEPQSAGEAAERIMKALEAGGLGGIEGAKIVGSFVI